MELSWFSVAEMPPGIRVHTVEYDHIIFGLDETFMAAVAAGQARARGELTVRFDRAHSVWTGAQVPWRHIVALVYVTRVRGGRSAATYGQLLFDVDAVGRVTAEQILEGMRARFPAILDGTLRSDLLRAQAAADKQQ
mmetsp:Transcript_29455/g.86056  ORF Transcript_29455/g.86056 Transcript_29455/m.86056 type:complete len:137 (-) Transcript_29455:780-1190(-)